MIKIIPVRAFKDNYIWVLVNSANSYCVVIDPGDATPVLDFINDHSLSMSAILITHHHHDHCGGVRKLTDSFPAIPVYGPKSESISGVTHQIAEQDSIQLPLLGIDFTVYDIPGHTHGHVAYYGQEMLFCGDTLFGAGCGRLFEGTADEMVQSLRKICSLPDNTLVYCAHEYTSANLRFAETVEPDNKEIQKRKSAVAILEKNHQPTLPSTLSLEKLTNPFLRCDQPTVIRSTELKFGKKLTDLVSTFAALRKWKDVF